MYGGLKLSVKLGQLIIVLYGPGLMHVHVTVHSRLSSVSAWNVDMSQPALAQGHDTVGSSVWM